MTAHLPLFSAIRSGDLSATSTHLSTLSSTSPWPRDLDGHTPLHWAAMSDTASMLHLVLQYVNNNRPVDVRAIATPQRDQTPLHWACVGGRLQSVLALLDTGADWSVVDAKGYTPVVHAVHYGRVDVVHVLVVRGGRRVVRVVDYEGHGVLEWAAYYGHVGVVVYLLRVCGVDVNTEYEHGMTALHRAAMLAHLAVVDVLLRAGADVLKRNEEGQNAEEVAPEGRVKRLLHMWAMGVLSREKPVGKRVTLRKYGFVLFYYVLFVASYLKFWEVATKKGVGFAVGFALHVGMLISAVSHVHATFGDPGDLEVGNEDKFVRYIEKAIGNGTSESVLGPSTFCYICLAPSPPRSKHSRERDRCVRLFDHECPWVNNTVGLYTHKTLLLLVTSTAFSQWLFIYVILRPLVDRAASFSKLSEVFVERPFVCLLVVLNSLVSAFCVMLLLTHIRLVLKGQTTFEYLTTRNESRVANPYDMGVWKNIIAFLTSASPGTEHAIPRSSLHNLREVVMSTSESQAPITADQIDEEKKRIVMAEYDAMNKMGTR